MRSASVLSRVRITPRTALVLGGSAAVGFACAEPARATDASEQMYKYAGALGIAAIGAYYFMGDSAPEYKECPSAQ